MSGPCTLSKGVAIATVHCEVGGRVLIIPATVIEEIGDAADPRPIFKP